ncbi:hypothetical protein RZS08_51960, partial [Arthrospira platensis SPKY1]|nr:hypothetical protein [Arthrospira platensis SPKY1]
MKTRFLLLSLLFAGFLAACNQSPEGQKVEAEAAKETAAPAADGTTYQVNPQASAINWTASKVSGEHNGTLSISNGALTVKDGALTGGSFTLDMKSITVLDLQGEQKGKLENHLRS